MVFLWGLWACSAPEPSTQTAEAPPMTVAVEDVAAETSGVHRGIDPRAKALFQPLPERMDDDRYKTSAALNDLGRMLYYEKRLSKNHDISCNNCHQLDNYGVDGERTSPGHKGLRGERNAPTTYNAALHLSQFWDGRAEDVEDQAGGPMLNPVKMSIPDQTYVLTVLKSMPEYVDAFQTAFPGEADAVNFRNVTLAIGAFERGLVTPAPIDAYLYGDATALTDAQVEGMTLFLDTGCASCHMGAAIGGGMYQKLGLVKAFETADIGRAKVTGDDGDTHLFKVPSLRNVTETGPYLHDGSIASLDEMVSVMAEYQLGKTLDKDQVNRIVDFLGALTGTPNAAYIAMPELPKSTDKTPIPDPT